MKVLQTDGWTDGQTDGQTEGQTKGIAIIPFLFHRRGLIIKHRMP